MERDTVTGRHALRGLTLIEMLLALFVLSLLAGLALPIVTGGILRAKESALKEDLYVMRKAIDDYYADRGSYPGGLDELVARRYLRRMPSDPFTDSQESWRLVWTEAEGNEKSGIIDVQSGTNATDENGVAYADW